MQTRRGNEARGFRYLVADVIKADLCCSCGTCAGACPQGIVRLDGDECLPAVEDEEECSAGGRRWHRRAIARRMTSKGTRPAT